MEGALGAPGTDYGTEVLGANTVSGGQRAAKPPLAQLTADDRIADGELPGPLLFARRAPALGAGGGGDCLCSPGAVVSGARMSVSRVAGSR
jgi:hypothetical protein